jgi:outer membrane protein assembly factor BamB
VVVATAAAVVVGAGLYTSGYRLVPAGNGLLSIRRQQSPAAQAQEIARHREAQRAAPPIAEITASKPPPGAHPVPTAAMRWPDFRGARRDGHYRDSPVRTDWPAGGLAPIWKQPAGGGHASFAVADGRAFTIEQRAGEEVVAAYDVMSGRELWTTGWPARFTEYYGGEGPRATPTWHGGVVYAQGAEGELRALDAGTGRLRWRTNVLDDAGAENLAWGVSASPLIVDDTVVVLPGGGGGRSLAAYHRESGKLRWSALDDGAAYSSPMLVTLAGVPQILVLTATRIVAVTADGARVLWDAPWQTQSGINVAQPLVLDGDRIFVSSGYGTGAALFQVSRSGDSFSVSERWRTNRMKNQFTSSVYHQGYIFGLDESILACLDASTGALKWKGGRYGYGQVLLASGHLIVTTEEGELVLVRATPDGHVELARSAALEGRTWNHPAVAGGVLLVRNGRQMAAFDLRPESD